jgi:hypothetical protein
MLAARPAAFVLSGIGSADPTAVLATMALLFGGGLLAAYGPAVVATRAEPAHALRAD